MSITTIQFTLRLFTALLLGAIVGLERQWRQRMAETRTTALVAAGASAFVMAGSLLVDDPSATGRVASYVVSGVGFLGAGVIFKDSANIRGLNTAATNWCSAAIGVLAGLGALHLSLLLCHCCIAGQHCTSPARVSSSASDCRGGAGGNDLRVEHGLSRL
jgi:putative Mg2+ transporter-C (MgtC) family protein